MNQPIDEPVLKVTALRVDLDAGPAVVTNLDFILPRGEILGIVGESGSGKTTAALAMLGYARKGVHIAGGSVVVDGIELLQLDEKQRRKLRGRHISYVPQDAGLALNPSLRIRDCIGDVLRDQADVAPSDHLQLLDAVDLPATEEFASRLPHQLSGGQQQRITIAMAMACSPRVIVMDEPTTGLDVVTQASVLEEIRHIRQSKGSAVVYVSHDLAVIAQIADRVAVMYAGRIVEEGPTDLVLGRPRHPYTRGLVQSIPDHQRRARLIPMKGTAVDVRDRPSGCAFAPRCPQQTEECVAEQPSLLPVDDEPRKVACLHFLSTPAVVRETPQDGMAIAERDNVLEVKGLSASHGSGRRRVEVASDVSFELVRGESLALVGQSGSGKTTIARCLVGLHRPDGGSILVHNELLASQVRRRTRDQRRRIQYIFQNPHESLNPRRTVGAELARAAVVLRGLPPAEARGQVPVLLDRVRLPARIAGRHPSQLSGGELQRVAVARALAAEPEILVCDEITSALDVSVQAAVLELLSELRRELGLSMLLITHDLGVVSVSADRVLVLEQGVIAEQGTVAQILGWPEHPYTQRLLAAAPTMRKVSHEPLV